MMISSTLNFSARKPGEKLSEEERDQARPPRQEVAAA
jgi:hypothetical protein